MDVTTTDAAVVDLARDVDLSELDGDAVLEDGLEPV